MPPSTMYFSISGHSSRKSPILLLGAEAHHMLDAGAVVPTAVEDHDLAGGREMLHVPLHVHLALFPIRRGGQRDNAKHARADALGDGADGPALARAVASLEHDDDAQPLGLHPLLERAELGLKASKFLLVLLAIQLGVLESRRSCVSWTCGIAFLASALQGRCHSRRAVCPP